MRYTVNPALFCHGYVVRDNVKHIDVQWCATEKIAQDVADRKNASLKNDTAINWKPWNGVPMSDNYINKSSAQLLEGLQDSSSEHPHYVMCGDTLIFGFRESDNSIAMYRCKILGSARFYQKPMWVQNPK